MTDRTGPRLGPALNIGERQRLGRIADVMLPATSAMPSATDVGVPGALVDSVLAARPDLLETLKRAIADLGDSFSLTRLDDYLGEDPHGYAALTTCVAGAYYLSAEVRDRIGYPGQLALTYDPYAYVQWVSDGLLDPVIGRGPVWRRPSDWKTSS